MKRPSHFVLGFDSIHDVIRAEKVIKEAGIWCDLVPTPREISSDCGMAVECREEDLCRLESLRQTGRLDWKLIYRPGVAPGAGSE